MCGCVFASLHMCMYLSLNRDTLITFLSFVVIVACCICHVCLQS